MNKKQLLLVLILVFISYNYFIQKDKNELSLNNSKIIKVVEVAKSFLNTPYRAGGTTKKGMDCSGLIHISFKEIGVSLPRSSKALSIYLKEDVKLENIKVGDFLFFDIARLKGGINHVGLVTSIKNNEIKFIHSTTKKGVIISSMKEKYWKKEFVVSKRLLKKKFYFVRFKFFLIRNISTLNFSK